MTAWELRQKFLDFFKSKGHTIIPSASLIPPETDPTALFTTAGMHPLVPYLLGEDHPGGRRVANIQKCIRTSDIDKVGDESHLTFFEMMGNWSFGDYFKKEVIEWSWEFLTDKKWLGIDPERITITVFEGDQDASRDEESANIWKSLGIPKDKIDYKNKEENWWGPAGATGPCGPDTEMFVDGVEIWNDVFMEYNKVANGKYEPLKQKNVDTGMGLERIAMIMQGKKDVYETDLFLPIMEKIKSVIPDFLPVRQAGIRDPENKSPIKSRTNLLDSRLHGNDNVKSFRIIADHIKASVFIIADGVVPSNVGRGYVVRRLVRRAVRYGKLLGIENSAQGAMPAGRQGSASGGNFTKDIAEAVIEIYKDSYPEVKEKEIFIYKELEKEENKFRKTIDMGLKYFEVEVFTRRPKEDGSFWTYNEVEDQQKNNVLDNIYNNAFNLYQTYGFPLEMILEEAMSRNIPINRGELEKHFHEEYNKHQQLSRTASAGQFKGGLAEAGEKTTRLHTATHLLLAALREVLGQNVYQKGSNITAERLRLDFSHGAKMTEKEFEKAENRVNEIIRENVPVVCEEMTVEEAKKAGAIGVFEEKYGEKVKVYTVGSPSTGSGSAFSREICGGPHASSTGELGHFKIVKEEASSAGVRRIKAILE